MSESKTGRHGWVMALLVALTLLLLAGGFACFAPVARCPYCVLVSRPVGTSCLECNEQGRVTLAQKWRLERSIERQRAD